MKCFDSSEPLSSSNEEEEEYWVDYAAQRKILLGCYVSDFHLVDFLKYVPENVLKSFII